MSYSFGFVAKNKEAAKDQVAEEMSQVVARQPEHAHDHEAVLRVADNVLDLVEVRDDQAVSVSCNGYVSWMGQGENRKFSAVSVCFAATAIDVIKETNNLDPKIETHSTLEADSSAEQNAEHEGEYHDTTDGAEAPKHDPQPE